MAYKMSEILPNLYLGNIVNSMDMRHLNEFNITHIVSVYEKPRERYPERKYLLLEAFDRSFQNLADSFPMTNDFIHGARLASSNVLVHCIKGISRSVTIVIAYIMSITDLGFHDALKFVQARRPIADPNDGFRKQLQEFESNGCERERDRLKRLFRWEMLYTSDMKMCEIALNDHQIKCNDKTESVANVKN